MPIDNSSHVAPFIPEVEDGEHFCYTEMLDRSKTKGNNGFRLMKTFYHRSRAEFWEQLETIKDICDMYNVRAMTRLGTRSFRTVGQTFARLVLDATISENWGGMKTLYQKACGTTPPTKKVWIWDIDVIDERTRMFMDEFLPRVHAAQRGTGHEPVVLARIPSKKGWHVATRPFDASLASEYMRFILGIPDGLKPNSAEISLHKDNPTNLYIPDGAA